MNQLLRWRSASLELLEEDVAIDVAQKLIICGSPVFQVIVNRAMPVRMIPPRLDLGVEGDPGLRFLDLLPVNFERVSGIHLGL